MRQEELNNRVRLTAEDDKYLYNGTIVCKIVVSPLSADVSQWSEIGKEEGDAIRSEQEAESNIAALSRGERKKISLAELKAMRA